MKLRLLFFILTFYIYPPTTTAQNVVNDTVDSTCIVVGQVLHTYEKTPIAHAKVAIFNEVTGQMGEIITENEGLYVFTLPCSHYFIIHATSPDSLHKSDLIPMSTNSTKSIQYKNLWITLPVDTNFVANSDTYIASLSLPPPPPDNPKNLLQHISFSVEIGVFSYIPNQESSFIAPIRDDLMIEPLSNGDYRLTIGVFNSYEKIIPFLDQVRKKGYQSARIIAYWGTFYVDMPIEDLLYFIEKP